MKKTKEQNKRYNETYLHSKFGLLGALYAGQLNRCKAKHRNLPNYTLNELRSRYMNDTKYTRLYDEWVKSGFKKSKRPSFDRINRHLSYTFENINLMTYEENMVKAHLIDRSNNKRKFYQIKNGEIIGVFYNIPTAHIKTKLAKRHLRAVLRGVGKTAGGFEWKYA